MARCDVCGNDYDKAFTITQKGRTHAFDSFECAIHAMAPACSHCSCAHHWPRTGSRGRLLLLRDCAEMAGVAGMRDRAG